MEFETLDMVKGLYPYLEGLFPAATGVMAEMEEYGRRRRFPIVGPMVGRFLRQLAMLSGANRVLELGSGYGYSAAWFLGASPRLHVTCTDSSSLNIERGLEFLERLGAKDRVTYLLGDSLDIVRDLAGSFDIVFCDLDKAKYPEAFELTAGKLRRGGVFIADNALWRGYAWANVPEDAPEFRRRATPGVRVLNRMIHEREDFLSTIVPIRDGVALAVRL